MRIGLIGDIHAEHRRLDAALAFLHGQSVTSILSTGDIADGDGCVDTCCRLLADASVVAVAGNHDRWLLADRLRDIPGAHRAGDLAQSSRDYLAALPATHTFDTPFGETLLCHGVLENDLRKVWPGSPRMPVERSPELDRLIGTGQTRLVINGHLHYRVVVNFEGLTMLNAGTLRGDHRPGVTILDLAKAEASAFEFDAALALHRVAEASLQGDGERRVWRDTQEFDGRWSPVTLYAA